VTLEGLEELALDDRPHLDGLIIRGREEIASITVELDGLHRRGVPLEDV